MLYYLFRFLEQYGISGSHMWGYISFRSLLALIFSLVISAWLGEKFIKFLKKKQITETQPRLSTAFKSLTIAFSFAIFCVPIACTIVTIEPSASGIAATASATANINASRSAILR